jgi:hypothetical protein
LADEPQLNVARNFTSVTKPWAPLEQKLLGCARRTTEGGCPRINIAHVNIHDVWG